jgi:hypothetical protein
MSLHVEVSAGEIPTNFALLLDDERALPEGIYFQPRWDDSRTGLLVMMLTSLIALIVSVIFVVPMYGSFFMSYEVDPTEVAVWSVVALVSAVVLRWSWRRHRFQRSIRGLVAAGVWREGLYLVDGHLFYHQCGVCTLIPHASVGDVVKDQVRSEGEASEGDAIDIDVIYTSASNETASFRIPAAPYQHWRDLLYWRAHGAAPQE